MTDPGVSAEEGVEESCGRSLTLAERSRVLLEVNNAVINSLRREDLVASVSRTLRTLIPFDKLGMSLFDRRTETLRLVAYEGDYLSDYFTLDREMPLDRSVSGEVFRTGRFLVRGDLETERRYESEEVLHREGIRSLCNVPIVVHGRALGVIGLASQRTRAYSDADARFLLEVAAQVGLAILNMQAYETLAELNEQHAHLASRLRVLLKISSVISGKHSRADLFRSICQIASEALACDSAGVALYDADADDLRIFALEGEYRSGMTVGGLLDVRGRQTGHPFDFRKPHTRPDLAVERVFGFEHGLYEEGLRSICLVPLTARGETIGTFGIGSRLPGRYSEGDVSFLVEIAAQVALAMANVTAYEEISSLKRRLEAENTYLQEEIRQEHNFQQIVGESAALSRVLARVEQVARTDSTVLLLGETGTGKELIARAIHDRSERKERPLVKVNCGALTAGLVESELFGHVKGAFTGALTDREGRFKLASGGTLFLDEVGELSLETQVKLLRVLQEQEFEPIGSNVTQKVDVRVVAATNRDLQQAIREGRFRSDLYYRLQVFPIRVPSLRERPEDVPLLVSFFLARYCKRFGRTVRRIPEPVMQQLVAYQWPGNIRELQNVIERAVVLSRGDTLELEVGFDGIATGSCDPAVPPASPPQSAAPRTAAGTSLEEVERTHIESVLRRTRWKVEGPRGAARILDLRPSTLRSRMARLGIHRPADPGDD